MKEFIEKLIGRLEEKKNLFAYKCVDYAEGLADAYEQSINIVNQLAEEYNNGWIACSERLPETGKRVLLCTKDKQVCQGKRIIFCEHNRYDLDGLLRYCFDDEIIAWQPLPQPYKERDKIE